MENTDTRRFIIWNPKHGDVPRSDDGGYLTSGMMGVLGAGNVYLTTYAAFAGRKHTELKVHQHAEARFTLSGRCGDYLVIRIA